jgi:hypothetical protein
MTVAARAPRVSHLPPGLMPLGLSRLQAAEFVGVSPSTFDKMVTDGLMPRPKRVGKRVLWDSRKLVAAFDELDTDGEAADDGPWEKMAL